MSKLAVKFNECVQDSVYGEDAMSHEDVAGDVCDKHAYSQWSKASYDEK